MDSILGKRQYTGETFDTNTPEIDLVKKPKMIKLVYYGFDDGLILPVIDEPLDSSDELDAYCNFLVSTDADKANSWMQYLDPNGIDAICYDSCESVRP